MHSDWCSMTDVSQLTESSKSTSDNVIPSHGSCTCGQCFET